MAYAFSRTLRALALDRLASPVWLVVATSLVGTGWLIWFFGARITLYEVTSNARLEVDRAAHPIATTISGRVVSTSLVLGKSVVAGQILVELDAEADKRRLEQEQQRLAALRSQLEATHRQLSEEERILVADAQVAHSALDIARVLRAGAESATGFAAEEVRHLAKAEGSVSAIELLRAQDEQEKRRYNHTALALEIVRLESDTQRRGAENLARYEKLRRDAVDLEGQINSTASLLKVLENEIERHKLRAPTNGRVGDVVPLPIGAVLHDGERVGVVVPQGELRIVADFSPAALGRMREGQAARLRLDGFSWLQYGSLDARVTKLGSEARDGRVSVELAVLSTDSKVPLQHGLPGTLEIEVERVAPVISTGAPLDHMKVRNDSTSLQHEAASERKRLTIVAWDLNTPVARMYVDGADVEAGGSTETNDTIDYTDTDWSISRGGIGRWDGCFSEFYLHIGATLDISNSTNREKFRSAGGAPVDLGATGSTPTGSQPIIYLHNASGSFQTNQGSGGNFTVTGTLDACASTP